MFLIFDTETTGLPKKWNAPLSDLENWPRCVQLAWQLHNEKGECISQQSYIINPDGYTIPFDAERIHGISTELAIKEGENLSNVLSEFQKLLSKTQYLCGHNVTFDLKILGAEFLRLNQVNPLDRIDIIDTCSENTALICKLPGGKGGRFKLPTLTELYLNIFKENFQEAHNASADVEATARCLLELIRTDKIFPKKFEEENLLEVFKDQFKGVVPLLGIKHQNLKEKSSKILQVQVSKKKSIADLKKINFKNSSFVHLHNHSQFSILQSTSNLSQIVESTINNNMQAVALTDHGNLMGVFSFLKTVKSRNNELDDQKKIKPIIGCELNVCEDHKDKTRRDDGYQILFLAKNKNGYLNLAKMSSIANIQGFYYVPRIDRHIVDKYKEDLIVLSGNLYGEVPSKILNIGENQAEKALEWWKEKFKNDFYIEIMRHDQEDEDRANEILIKFSKKHKIPIVATNNNYYLQKEEANAHDILLCLKEGEKQDTPIGKGRGFRYGFPNQEYYFKSQEQMFELFNDIPEAIFEIEKIVDKIESYDLSREVVLPKFKIPPEFIKENDSDYKIGENKYLKHLTYIGAKKRYGEINQEVKSRINFELQVISNSGYPGYFLIIQDLIEAARNMDVSVGPGRGSAAGSVVAYSLGIVNLDPIKYNLLFERFLNPDRVSLPDIDIDFDDEGRSKVMDYVIKKYGSNQVAQIITYGKMAAKSSIRDTARVLDLHLSEADRISKLLPNIKLSKIFNSTDNELKEILRNEEYNNIKEFKQLSKDKGVAGETIQQAKILEGSLRNTGIHACGVIITPSDITNFVPVTRGKESDLYVTQFDNSVVEDAGLLKMDFLGLKTLTLIKDTVKLVKYKHDLDLDPDTFPLDDIKTYELFQKGETVGIFQYESAGMQKYLKELKPNVFDDLIAMNALYRPGPLEYIPSFVSRKNGREEIKYDLPIMEEFLKETYGITVYQEQVMILSQELAGFSKGEADLLRKAMGKKIFNLLERLKPKFINGGKENGHDEIILEKIWKDWEAFASYAFNKSHSTCYAWIGYQTAYLKAHYPAEYMAAVLSNNMNDIKQVTFFMEECRRMGLTVLGPDVNESFYKFTVNDNQAIRFGMGAIKGVGRGAVETIIEKRKKSSYKSIFDLTKKIDLRAANKKTLENLTLAGALDSFKRSHRAQYFSNDSDGIIFIEKAIRYGSKYQENINSSQINLFGDESQIQIAEVDLPLCEEWTNLEKLKKEKEVVGIYISAHPLDDFKREMKYFSSTGLSVLKNLDNLVNKELSFGGIISDVSHLLSRNGKGWGKFIVEDFKDHYEFKIFGEDYLKYKHFLVINQFIRIKVLVKEGWTNRETGIKSEPRIQFNYFEQLQDSLDLNSKKLTLQLKVDEVNEEKISKLTSIFKKFKGKKSLEFDLFESSGGFKLTLPSRKQKIKINNDLLDNLERNKIFYKIN